MQTRFPTKTTNHYPDDSYINMTVTRWLHYRRSFVLFGRMNSETTIETPEEP